MAINQYFKKRPCKICRKWFVPNPRVGSRQQTCGAEECKRKWHTKKCADWNKQNRQYFQSNYLKKKLQAAEGQKETPKHPPSLSTKSSKSSQLPQDVIQEVIDPQQLVIIEYVSRQLLKGVQEVIRKQAVEITEITRRLLPPACSRGDRRMNPP